MLNRSQIFFEAINQPTQVNQRTSSHLNNICARLLQIPCSYFLQAWHVCIRRRNAMTLSIPHPASEQGKLISTHSYEYEHCLFAHIARVADVVRPLPFTSRFNRIWARSVHRHSNMNIRCAGKATILNLLGHLPQAVPGRGKCNHNVITRSFT